jgi:hypothetical protein
MSNSRVCFESRVDGWELELVEYAIFQRVLVPLVCVFAGEACEKFVVPSESYNDSTVQFLSVNKHFNVDEKHYRSSLSTSFLASYHLSWVLVENLAIKE